LNGTIWNGGEMTMNGGVITSNTVTAYGGGIDIYGGILTVNGGTIDDNVNNEGNRATDNFVLSAGKIIDTNGNFINDTNIYVMLTALDNNYALDVSGSTIANGTNIQIYQSNKTIAQKWKVIPRKVIDGTIYYSLQNQADGTQYAWISGNSSVSGTNVNTWEMHNSIGGDWTFSNLGNGYYEVKSILGTCLDVYNSDVANSVNVWAYTCNQSIAQKWKFVDYDSASVAVINSISMSSWVSSEGSYQSCTGKWEDFMFNFDISITGGSVSSGKMCYAANSSSASSYCKNYANSGSTGYGVACFNSATNWVFYRSGHCAYAYATGSHGLSTSRFQC